MSCLGRHLSSLESGDHPQADSALGSLSGIPQPEALLLEDGDTRRKTRDSPSGAVPLSLKGLLSPRAPVSLGWESYPLPCPPLCSNAQRGGSPGREELLALALRGWCAKLS